MMNNELQSIYNSTVELIEEIDSITRKLHCENAQEFLNFLDKLNEVSVR